MNWTKKILLISVLAIIGLGACERGLQNPDLPDDIRILNHWIWENMNIHYLWEDQLPHLDPDFQEDPEAYFYELKVDQDRFSRIFENYDQIQDALDGIELTNGISPDPALFRDSILVFLVEYVYEGTVAGDAGIKRGDIITAIDGQKLTKDNYLDLYYQETATFEFSDWNGNGFTPNGKKLTLTAEKKELNPVVHSEIIEAGGKKTGYLVYTMFTYGKDDEWLREVDRVLSDFKSAGISDLVVDLRYNPGGYSSLAGYLASCIAPSWVSQQEEVFSKLVWNDAYNEYWKEQDLDEDGHKDGEDSPALVERFPEGSVNLDLERVYFLTTGGTASSSELLMTGLYPYMDVVQIGESTVGKCFGSILMEDDKKPKRHNWAMMPLVMKYANADGFTDFINGIHPDIELRDNLLYAVPFGDLSDPLLASALEQITGQTPSLKRSGQPVVNYESLYKPSTPLPERGVGLLPSL